MFEEMDLRDCTKENFRTYLNRAYEWCKTGSATGSVTEVNNDEKLRLNKRGALSNAGAHILS